MEGGNKYTINFESPLDVNTSDMLVPVQQPTFQHNFQRYQGKFLPNSLRFEKNGWAAGWNVYNFKYNQKKIKVSDNVYTQLVRFSDYVDMLGIYKAEDDVNPDKSVPVIKQTRVVQGDAAIEGSILKGTLNNKEYAIDLTDYSITDGFELTHSTGSDYIETLNIKDVEDSFEIEVTLLLGGDMTGASIQDLKYLNFEDGVHTWGGYTYSVADNVVKTPEGVSVTPSITDNEIVFSYDVLNLSDELEINYTMDKYYLKFTDISFKDNANEQMTIGQTPSQRFAFNFYKADSDTSELVAEDEHGVIVDFMLPLWLSYGFTINRASPNAVYCNNIKHNEVALKIGKGLRNKVRWENIFGANGEQDLADNYRYDNNYVQYITDATYRFNQIFAGNTIEPSTAWSPNKYDVAEGDVWYKSARQFYNLRTKKIDLMTSMLGDVYTWGNFTFVATDFFDTNNPWDWEDRDNCVYTQPDISDILSVKLASDDDNTDEGDDLQFVEDNYPVDISIIATYTGGSVTEYNRNLPAKTYDELYDGGKYIGGVYETIGITDEDESTFWPFEKVPRFNLNLQVGVNPETGDPIYNEIKGVYWTNGTTYIVDFDEFRNKLLGDYDEGIDKKSSVIIENADYSRERYVKTYAPVYDFDFKVREDFISDDAYNAWKDSFDKTWSKYYPTVTSPTDRFDSGAVSGDLTYLNYADIEIFDRVKPGIQYVTPGVYLFGNYAVPYDTSTGLVIYNEGDDYTLTPFVYHHTIDKISDYTKTHTIHEHGYATYEGRIMPLPYYFGSATAQKLVAGNGSATRFTSITDSAELTSSALTLGINYTYDEEIIIDDEGREFKEYVWNPATPEESHWLGGTLVKYSGGKIEVQDNRLNSGVEAVSAPYIYGDASDGVKVGWPIWAHSGTQILYPEMFSMSSINGPDAFIVQPADDALLDPNKVYFDRDSAKSEHLFDVTLMSKMPDDQQGGGNMVLTLSNVSAEYSGLYYAPKKTNTMGGEQIFSYYLPGVCFGDKELQTGNLTFFNTGYPNLELDWAPVTSLMPLSASVSFTPDISESVHKFYTEDYKLLTGNVTLGEYDSTTNRKYMTVSLNGHDLDFYYDCVAKKTVYEGTGLDIISNDIEKVRVTGLSGSDDTAEIALVIDLYFSDITAKFYDTIGEAALQTVSPSREIVLDVNGTEVVYSESSNAIVKPKVDYTNITDMDGSKLIYLKKEYTDIIGIVVSNCDGDSFWFEYDGNSYIIDITLFDDIDTFMDVLCTDVKSNKTRSIGRIDASKEYQLIKQQWNSTSEVENFWWVDDKHVLELTYTEFILKRKTGELSDWDGDEFTPVFNIDRASVLNNEVCRYFVTNCYNTNKSALFVIITIDSDTGNLKVRLFDIRDSFNLVDTFEMSVRYRQIGSTLNDVTFTNNTALLNTYGEISNKYVLSKAVFSNTFTDGKLILGVHVSNNFDQWAVVYDTNTHSVNKVVQGYGYVGLHGDLTGGQIPNMLFDVDRGFSDTVHDLSALSAVSPNDLTELDNIYNVPSVNVINNLSSITVGDAEQQWYIYANVQGIVSHLTYSNGKFTKQVIPITNNFSASFMSPSWSSSLLADNIVNVTPFSKLFSLEGAAGIVWNLLCGLFGNPMLYTLAPRLGSIAYINMTFGQYAYVHYNSTRKEVEREVESDNTGKEAGPEDTNKQTAAIFSADFAFDKQKFTQTLSTEIDIDKSFLTVLVVALCDSLNEVTNEKLSVNEELLQTATSDFGRNFSDNAIANIQDMISSNVAAKSRTTSSVSGTVTGIKTLDMFYSTSDTQKVMAGPGFVEHQFTAACVAQSSTTLQLRGKVYQMFWCISQLTLVQLKLQIYLLRLAAENLRKLSDSFVGAMVCAVTYGMAVSAAFVAAATALDMAAAAQEVGLEAVTQVLSAFDHDISVRMDANISRQALSVEAKHKYGEKNEEFMWPCWGVSSSARYHDERVIAGTRNTPWMLKLESRLNSTDSRTNMFSMIPFSYDIPLYSYASGRLSDFYSVGYPNITKSDNHGGMLTKECVFRAAALSGKTPYYQATCYGEVTQRALPSDMAKIEGVRNILPSHPFRNENIGMSEPAFAPSLFQDYIIDKPWELGMCCTYGSVLWLSVKDTKIINCAPSNMYINTAFCGVATSYTAVEVKRGLSKAYMRPWAVTPNVLAFNSTGFNSIYDKKLYHAFDGISYRITDLVGAPGMSKNLQTFFYSFQKNDRFKRSNICPANEMQGNFKTEPTQSISCIDELFTLMTIAAKEKGLEGGAVGEDKDASRWALPMFTEPVTTLPAAVKTLTAMPLNVFDGITALTTNLANNQTAYKAPISVDFTIGKNVYRQTEDYICSVTTQEAIDVVTEIVPSLGLTFIGSTPTEAYFYSKATRCYYLFTGSSLTKMDSLERFRDVQRGYWDFVNQEVVMPCLMTYKRLNAEVEDKDSETDNIIVPVLSKGQVNGEVIPPVTTIFNDRSWYKAVSLPSGFAFQGPNRVIINRNVFVEYMLDSVKSNFGKWSRINKEKYTTRRIYPEVYEKVDKDISTGVDGWTHNQFVLVTSPIGVSDDTDCLYEWVITFCWPIEMDLLYGVDNYAVVNITAETMTQGGKIKSRPTHVYLTKELFTRDGNYGYYSFRFQSKNGIGNRERLHIWSDQYIAISKLDCEIKQVTSRRHEQLTQQLDIQKLKEL